MKTWEKQGIGLIINYHLHLKHKNDVLKWLLITTLKTKEDKLKLFKSSD